MAITLSSTVGSLPTPVVVLETSHNRSIAPNNQIHELLDGGLAVTLRTGRSATGKLRLAYTTRANAETVFAGLRGASTFTYTNTDPVRSFNFVVVGNVTLDQAVLGNADAWVVEVEYRELT